MICEINQLPKSGFHDCAGVKIRALFKAYGAKFEFCRFYEQRADSGETLALLSAYEGAVTVSVKKAYKETERQELTAFLTAIGFSELICKEPILKEMPHEKIYAVSVENSVKNSAVNPHENPNVNPNVNSHENLDGLSENKSPVGIKTAETQKDSLAAVYKIFQGAQSSELSLPPFERWYADASHRLHHRAAKYYCKKEGAAFVHLDGENAYLAGIAVLPQFREKGIGKEILTELSKNGPDKKLFAFCRKPLLKFYRAAGFSRNGSFCLYQNNRDLLGE